MRKTYTIKEKNYEKITAIKGTIRYVLQDSDGSERTVMAMADLGLTKKIKAVRPVFHRETPLVEALTKASVNDSIKVDFSIFNEKNPRVSSANSRGSSQKVLIQIQNSRSSSLADVFRVDTYRILQLFIVTTVGFVFLYSLFNNFDVI